ncbi:hypothetical protein [Nitrospira sp. Nam80]
MLETAGMIPPAKMHPAGVKLYRDGAFPEAGCFKRRKWLAHGNGYANMHTLESKIQEEAADIGTESVIILGSHVSNGTTFGTYGGGLAI